MKQKNEVFQKFQDFQHMVERETGEKIKRPRADNSLGEYTHTNFAAYRKNQGIAFKPTIPYGANQNGVSERANRTVVSRAKCMIHNAGIDKKWWGAAVLAAIYLKNRSPTTALPGNKPPYEMWHGKAPGLTNVRVFGCTAYNSVPRPKRKQKMYSESRRCIFLGYAGGHNQYHLYDIESKSLTVGRDVIFDESDVCCPSRNDCLEFDKPTRDPVNILTRFDTLQSSLEGEGENHDSDLNSDIFNDNRTSPEPEAEPEIQNDSDSQPEPEPGIQNDSDSEPEPEPEISDSGSEPEPASQGEVEAEPLPERPRPGPGDRRISTRSNKGICLTSGG